MAGAQSVDQGRAGWNLGWAALAVGLASVFLPTYWKLAATLWQSDENAHGGLIVAVSLYLLWSVRRQFVSLPEAEAKAAGSAALMVGALLYVVGRSQGVLVFECFAHIPILIAVVLWTRGWAGLRLTWFPIFFLLFMVPLPGPLVNALTGPLKHHVSVAAENVLYFFGLPIGRTGVVLFVGPYQLLVADACSGLHSIFSLSALGLLFLYIMGRKNPIHNAIVALTVVPIAIAANIARVMILVLVTYYLGDEAGQGFLHGFAGMVLFVSALLLLFALDGVLALWLGGKAGRAA